jgi:hypothetical protein
VDAKLGVVTTREKAHKLLDELPEDELEPLVEFIASRGANGTGNTVDEWGNLDAQTDAAAGDLMARLDEEEIAEFGETISQAWGYESPRETC